MVFSGDVFVPEDVIARLRVDWFYYKINLDYNGTTVEQLAWFVVRRVHRCWTKLSNLNLEDSQFTSKDLLTYLHEHCSTDTVRDSVRNWNFTFFFLSPPSSKCLQRLIGSCFRNLHSVHSIFNTIFLVVFAYRNKQITILWPFNSG